MCLARVIINKTSKPFPTILIKTDLMLIFIQKISHLNSDISMLAEFKWYLYSERIFKVAMFH